MVNLPEKFGADAIPLTPGVFTPDPGNDQEFCLRGARCPNCNTTYFPFRRVCPKCLDRSIKQELPVGRRARLSSCTRVEVAPPGFTAPYVLGYVDLEEGPHIFTLIDVDPAASDTLPLGTPMQLQVQGVTVDEAGHHVIGWKYRPVEQEVVNSCQK